MATIEERLAELENRMNSYHPQSQYKNLYVVNTDSLRLRDYPPDGPVSGGMTFGEKVMASDEIVVEGGYTWRHVQRLSNAITGWCAEEYLREYTQEQDHWALTDNLAQQHPIAFIKQDNPNRVTDDFWGGGVSYPCTVVLRDIQGVGHSRLRMTREMLRFLVGLNDDADYNSTVNACNIESGIFNNQPMFNFRDIDSIPDDELPKPEPITTGGNFVAVKEMTVKGIQVVSFERGSTGMNTDVLNYSNAALVVHKFLAMHKDYTNGYVKISSPTGVASMVYNPLVKQRNGVDWIMFEDDFTRDRVEMLPNPETFTFIPSWNVPIRTGPSIYDEKVGHKTKGVGFKIWYYYPTDSGLWARLEDGNYLALGYQPYLGRNYVAWSTNYQIDGWMPMRAE